MATRKHLESIATHYGAKSMLSEESDAKTIKGTKLGYLTGILYLMPDDKLCPMARLAGCREGCLVSAGMAAVYGDHIQGARKARTVFFRADPQSFLELLEKDIQRIVNKAHKRGLTPAIRLNGTSDINWSTIRFTNGETIFDRFPGVQFYDYTKSPGILNASRKVNNWHITFSYSGASSRYSAIAEEQNANLAVVFNGAFPEEFLGRRVINGDETDLRFLDPEGVIVGLKAKGEAKKDTTGFVVST
jgi:hypothetical protein